MSKILDLIFESKINEIGQNELIEKSYKFYQ